MVFDEVIFDEVIIPHKLDVSSLEDFFAYRN
jgi:hypothetical protein